jgi:acyl carrier protein
MLTDQVNETVFRRLAEVMREGESARFVDRIALEATLNGDLALASLDLAQLVALLEADLQADPFVALVPITSVRTVGDLCRAYQRALAGEAPAAEDPALAAVRDRAAARRDRRGP